MYIQFALYIFANCKLFFYYDEPFQVYYFYYFINKGRTWRLSLLFTAITGEDIVILTNTVTSQTIEVTAACTAELELMTIQHTKLSSVNLYSL